MNEGYKATLKSSETEDWLDLHVIRPFCYYCALAFNRFDIHPNTVTIWSMIIGAASAGFFACGSFYYSGTWGLMMNIIAIVLLMIADILDCTDGQLARLSGKKSRIGRILDGVAGFAWFTPIYVLLVYRFYLHHDIEFGWLGIENTEENTLIATGIVFVLGLISGIMGLAGQQRLADYYIQIHLFFLKGEKGSELDNSVRQQEIYDQIDMIRIYLKPQGQEADMKEPLIVKRGNTVGDVCELIHRDFRNAFRYAMVWGKSAKFPGQTVGMDHVVEDEDILCIIVKRS